MLSQRCILVYPVKQIPHPEEAEEEPTQNIYKIIKPETSRSQMQIENKGNTLEKTVLSKEQTVQKAKPKPG